MKALSLHQPYAEMIVSGQKTIEIRSWRTPLREEFLVHAAKKIRLAECKRLNLSSKLPVGHIVGKAELVAIKKYDTQEQFDTDYNKHLAEPPVFSQPCYGFVLENPTRLDPPIPARGFLRFFNIEI